MAFALFTIICVILLSLTSNTSLITRSLQASIERSSGLRGALNWLSADFRDAVIRDDLPPVFVESTGNDAFYFHAAADGYGGERGITLVGYRVRDGNLERGAQGTDWDTRSIPFGKNLAADDFIVNPQNDAYDVLGRRIFRMETEFLMDDGTFRNDLAPGTWKNVSAISVTLATIDGRSLERSPATLDQLAALFPDRPSVSGLASGEPIVKEWSQRLLDPEFMRGDAGVPAEARRGIQVRHRLFPINHE